jgi:hypothetical protein
MSTGVCPHDAILHDWECWSTIPTKNKEFHVSLNIILALIYSFNPDLPTTI